VRDSAAWTSFVLSTPGARTTSTKRPSFVALHRDRPWAVAFPCFGPTVVARPTGDDDEDAGVEGE
jgi:hypothetical protein